MRSRLKTAKGASKDSKFSVPVVDLTGKRKGSVELPKEIFGANVNEKLMAQAVRVYLVNQRQGTASTKTRGEVTGSTRKIYRQKGTGRARHGSITAPIFRGGGIVFGPRVRGFSLKLSKQMKKKALSSALAQKLLDQKVSVVDLEGVSGKTRELAQLFKNLKLLDKEKKDNQVLFVSASKGEAKRAARNIRGITVSNVESINTYEVLANKYLILARDAVPNLVNHFIKNNL
ncbi:MAG: 50S ribosomal protein L4 [Candidatus Levybacteria bacterium RIFCSPHIGHO2_02_FULL_40_18]|nr:MAG: 50S ribosomal protein L4 [Candidatus Levybacteria bacterium RIFCSPHIGHO2_01_FULL_40_58]OGH26508.1 MAG: 50S ribosomal protein L4 [Candidatus Levybacteria bacterium RIFCSPHIGHO2_02_FULL_40_18]OGH31959.1 MAG: 50S ribosomal protein L4 [Candidatus Levybacteria bacterium RIFCSPHIGHO2_12_FULL_40_31]OGH40525.1 MAG: 50S ribosomal protein L4 [Candidatus Levybacteria bacterium RIFCSPLOWO2_01_FULL_40_64]OGH49207.1 MAG: 50S ribosomal protein L4 [Candidatus Levybacteria bacterium RIFCSPLOWO2_02_FULL_